ncbi:site-specific DNA-methyltransferase [Salisediminibacterium selenitireducens]|uniref:Methyltransferase n=1 Tax=Bacillus selenitireducens (strain ATCC 700615 / DSM 15326 / MLS10) TaxID=439292 RepID=D6XZD6_BACIE|nr:site-specific DNA-methyltransferase [Salisediminibacterium selenitireducens]ADH98310.1 DNA methylase N-4/N-6 domain protein [[Bacillus] selenitireducens MLS10]
MDFQKLAIEELIPAGYNPRKQLKPGDPEFEKIKTSIETFGYVDPVIVNADHTVIGGHQRLTVLKTLGYDEIDCVVIDIDKTKEKALNIALNKISGEWNKDLLVELIEDLQSTDIDIGITGFDPPEIDQLFNEVHDKDIDEDDFDVDAALQEETITQPGDVWQLGRHKLICGDSTEAGTYETLMAGEKANLIVTDLPYNVDYEGSAGKIQNDNMGDQEFYTFLLKAYQNMFGHLEDGAGIYVFHADRETVNFRTAMKDAGFFIHQTCIWVKNAPVLNRCDYLYTHEPILYGWKPTAGHKFYGDRKQRTVWNFDRPTKSDLHPTMKPVALCAYPIQNSSLSNCIVLDPFGGSGSTMMACEQTNRIARLIELDPKYADVIVKRYIDFKEITDDVTLIRGGKAYTYEDLILVD